MIASRLHSRKSRVKARRGVTARGLPGLSSDAPELALELLNLLPATRPAVKASSSKRVERRSSALAFQIRKPISRLIRTSPFTLAKRPFERLRTPTTGDN